MSHLHRRPQHPDALGIVHQVTPQNAGWQYVGFEVRQLDSGVSQQVDAGADTELCLVILSGLVQLKSSNQDFGVVGARMSVFEDAAPFALYVPAGECIELLTETACELAFCRAPSAASKPNGSHVSPLPVRLIGPSDCSRETRGQGTNTRFVCNILFGNAAADRLLITEVITPPGHWSSYPPHKHDSDALPLESALEETYYHKLNPSQGFAFQRVYTDDRRLDETISVEHNSLVLVPEGYHPVGAPHGYQLYYLNVMAGPTRQWVFKNDPAHEWMLQK